MNGEPCIKCGGPSKWRYVWVLDDGEHAWDYCEPCKPAPIPDCEATR